MADYYLISSKELRTAFNKFLNLNGYSLVEICIKIQKEGFGYTTVSKYLPQNLNKIESSTSIIDINNFKQIKRLVDCIIECLKVEGYQLVNEKGEVFDKLETPDNIPFYDPVSKSLRTAKLDEINGKANKVLTEREKYEETHPECHKYLVFHPETGTVFKKYFLYVDPARENALIFYSDKDLLDVNSVRLLNGGTTILNFWDHLKEVYWQIIFQKSIGVYYQGVFSSFSRSKPPMPVCGNLTLIKMDIGQDESSSAILKGVISL